jgi:hypothetical protein
MQVPVDFWRSEWIYDMAPKNGTGRIHPMANLFRLCLATLTFLVFFYSTTLLTSYFYPLDWAPVAF